MSRAAIGSPNKVPENSGGAVLLEGADGGLFLKGPWELAGFVPRANKVLEVFTLPNNPVLEG